MRICPLLIFLALLSSVVMAGDLRSTDGTVYHHSKVLQIDPDGLVVEYDKGIAKIDFHRLPPEMRQQFAFSERKAAIYRAQETQVTQENQRIIKEHEEQELARIQKLMESGGSGSDFSYGGNVARGTAARLAKQLQQDMEAKQEATVAAARQPRTFWNAPFWQAPVVRILGSFLSGSGGGKGGGEGPIGNGAGYDNHHGLAP